MPIKATGKTTKAKTLETRKRSLGLSGQTAFAAVPSSPLRRILRLKRQHIIFLAALVVLAGAFLIYRNLLVVATVNGEPISRLAVIDELEKQSGKQAVNGYVTKILVQQEAKKQNITVTQEEINQELKKIEDNFTKQGQKLAQVLEANGMTQDSLREQVRLQKLIEKLVGKDIKVTDQEVKEYIEKNKQLLPEGTDPNNKTVIEDTRQQLRQQKLNEKFQSWIAKLREQAKITVFIKHLSP